MPFSVPPLRIPFLTGHAYLEPFSIKTFDTRTILHVLYVKSCQSGRQSLSSKITS